MNSEHNRDRILPSDVERMLLERTKSVLDTAYGLQVLSNMYDPFVILI